MSIEKFKDEGFYGKVTLLIHRCQLIIHEYTAAGYVLTLRQLYYQLVSRNYIKNSENSYKSLSAVLVKARENGLIDWDAMEDRVRYLKVFGERQDTDTDGYVQEVYDGYREDVRRDQDNYIEVWPEKDALTAVVSRVCSKLRVPFFTCRGFNSATEMYIAAKRHEEHRANGREVYVLHFGDHDASGMDMSRDNEDRLQLYSNYTGQIIWRCALNMDQIKLHKPPPNPTKEGDSRAANYIRQFGHECWELDALNPSVLGEIISERVIALTDMDKLKAMIDNEGEARNEIRTTLEPYAKFVELVRDGFNNDEGDYVF